MIIDSEREIDRNLGEYFPANQVIGDSEIIVNDYALTNVGVSADRKEKVEIYLDILNMLDLLSSLGLDIGGADEGLGGVLDAFSDTSTS